MIFALVIADVSRPTGDVVAASALETSLVEMDG